MQVYRTSSFIANVLRQATRGTLRSHINHGASRCRQRASIAKLSTLPLKTEGLVVERPNSGFKLMPVVLENMRSDEVLVEMKYSGICHTVSAIGWCLSFYNTPIETSSDDV